MRKLIICGLILYSSTSYGFGDTLICSIQGGAQLSDGNIKNHSYNVSAEAKGIHKKKDWSIAPSYRYMISYPYPITPTSTPSKQNEFYMVSHISHRFDDKWKVMLFSEIEHSQLRKINLRYNLGIGPSYKLINSKITNSTSGINKTIMLELSDVIMPDYYESLVIANSIPKKDNLSLRTSLRLKFVFTSGSTTITSSQTFQPSLKTWTRNPNEDVGWADNTNFRSLNSADVRIIGGLCFGVSVDYIYQSYLNYIAKDPEVIQSGIYLSPQDISICLYLKYRSK